MNSDALLRSLTTQVAELNARFDRFFAATPTDYLTLAQVAARCGVHSRTVRRWIKTGKLPAHQLGRRVLVAVPALEAFILSGGSAH